MIKHILQTDCYIIKVNGSTELRITKDFRELHSQLSLERKKNPINFTEIDLK